MARDWRYLVLAVDGRQGRRYWDWSPSMKSADLAPTVQGWKTAGLQAVIWDGATGHSGPEIVEVGLPRIKLPPVSPELNPTERVFACMPGLKARSIAPLTTRWTTSRKSSPS